MSTLGRLTGYVGASITGQTLEAQLEQLTNAKYLAIHREAAFEPETDRKQLWRMLAELQSGDFVPVTRDGRLAR